jgi:hypothetical protein
MAEPEEEDPDGNEELENRLDDLLARLPPMTPEEDREQILICLAGLLNGMSQAQTLALRDRCVGTQPPGAPLETILELLEGHLELRRLLNAKR